MRNSFVVAALSCILAFGSGGESPATASNLATEAPEPRQESAVEPSLDDFAFLVGHWRGEALGGVAEEVWLEPAGGQMVGTFRLVKDGEVSFYEIFTISEPDLTLRLKHFHGDLVGWEEREEIVTFPFVSAGDGEAIFEGLTFRLLPDGRLRAAVMAGEEGGEARELVFLYERAE